MVSALISCHCTDFEVSDIYPKQKDDFTTPDKYLISRWRLAVELFKVNHAMLITTFL